MDYNAKRAKLSGVIYIILSLMLVMIMCVTLFTFIAPKRNEDPKDQTKELITDAPNTPSDVEGEKTEAIVDVDAKPDSTATENTTDAKDQSADLPVPEEKTFSMPISGHIINECSLDTLVYSLTMEDYRAHTGIDIECPDKSEIRACSDGTISSVYNDPLWGWCITIDHGDELVSVYKGLSENLPEGISVGTAVCEGDIIAISGDTAIIETALPYHLHFEMMHSGEYVDPFEFIPVNTFSNESADETMYHE